jgi:hypothetical protein
VFTEICTDLLYQQDVLITWWWWWCNTKNSSNNSSRSSSNKKKKRNTATHLLNKEHLENMILAEVRGAVFQRLNTVNRHYQPSSCGIP